MPGSQRTAIGLVGNDGRVDGSRFETLPGVAQVIHVTKPYKQASREWHPENTIVTIAPGVHVGGEEVTLIAGPCSVESEEQIVAAARAVRAAGASCLRGGAFKPRSSPYSFQGLGKTRARAACASRNGKRGWRSSPRPWTTKAPSSSPSTRTASRSARATCRTTRCCAPLGG